MTSLKRCQIDKTVDFGSGWFETSFAFNLRKLGKITDDDDDDVGSHRRFKITSSVRERRDVNYVDAAATIRSNSSRAVVAKLGLDEVSCLVCALSKKLLAGTEKNCTFSYSLASLSVFRWQMSKHSSLIKTEIDYALGKPQSAV